MSQPTPSADLILHHGLFTTLARSKPTATAVAIRDGRFLVVGTDSEAMALAGPKTKVAVTPPPQWVRVVGGFSEHQFAEKRLPTIPELNAVAPDTPVFLLHLYDRAILNAAALRAVGYTKDTPNPPGGEIVH